MAISRNDAGFLEWTVNCVLSLGLESNQLDRCVSEIKRRKIRGVFGSAYFGFDEANLDFLADTPALTSIDFWDTKLKSIDKIYDLRNLVHLRISNKRPPMSFSRLSGLETLVIDHNKRDTDLSALKNLKMLNLWHHKEKQPNVFEFGLPQRLERLGLFWTNVESLEGFGANRSVRELEIARSRNIRDLGDLKSTFPKLEKLVVTSCGRLSADSAALSLKGHPNIRHAFAGGKLLKSDRS